MAKDRELRKLLAPLLQRRRELAYHRRTLFFSPLKHYLRGVFLGFSIWSDATTLTPICDILFDGGESPNLGGRLGDDLYLIRDRHYPSSQDQDPERTWQEILLTLEREILPLVEQIDDPVALDRSVFSSPRQGPRKGWQVDRVLGLCALGDFDAAEKLLDAAHARGIDDLIKFFQINIPDATDEELKFHPNELIRITYLHRVLKRNRAEVIPLLHEWEAHKVRMLKLEKYWKPTPFPCET